MVILTFAVVVAKRKCSEKRLNYQSISGFWAKYFSALYKVQLLLLLMDL
jgi:hypothetical protein